MKKTLSFFEVGLRDGLQSEAKILSIEEKVKLGKKLLDSGLLDLEVGSFVREDRIPQMAQSGEVLAELIRYRGQIKSKAKFWAFIPNMRGLELALKANVEGCSFFIASSNTFCLKNVNRSQEEVLSELEELVKVAVKNKKATRVYLSTIVFCPYEGVVATKSVVKLVKALKKLRIQEIVLSDTTGHAHPTNLSKLLTAVLKVSKAKDFSLHLHDTRGTALANVVTGIDFGITRFDSSVAGMGGCPYAPGASGNLATEDLVYLLQSYGAIPKVSLMKIAEAGLLAESILQKKLPSKVLRSKESELSKACL